MKKEPNHSRASKKSPRDANGAPRKMRSKRLQWLPHLDLYDENRLLTFASEADLDAAIELLWTDALRNLPHDTPDGRSLIVPGEAVPYFRRAGLNFSDEQLRSINDLTADEIRELRK